MTSARSVALAPNARLTPPAYSHALGDSSESGIRGVTPRTAGVVASGSVAPPLASYHAKT